MPEPGRPGRIDKSHHMWDMGWKHEDGHSYLSRRPHMYFMPSEFYFEYLAVNPLQVRVFLHENPEALECPKLANFVLHLQPSLLPVFPPNIRSNPTRVLRWARCGLTVPAEDKAQVARIVSCMRDQLAAELTLKAVVDKMRLDASFIKEMRAYILPSDGMFRLNAVLARTRP